MTEYPPQENESTKDAAKSEAREVGREGAAAGQQVAGVAKAEAKQVAHEAKEQARGLASQLGNDLRSQAGQQQQRVAGSLRSLSDELHSMANASENGTASNLVQQVAQRAGNAAGWLDNRDPGSLLDEVRRFARQRPGAFLAVAAGAGLLAGRLTRGLTSDEGTSAAPQRTSVPPRPATPPHNTAVPPSPDTNAYGSQPAYTQPMTGVDPVAGPAAVGYEQVTDLPPTGTDPLTGERPVGYNPDQVDIDPSTDLPRHRSAGL